MSTVLGKKSLLKKVGEVGISTFLSRILGIAREVLLVQYLGEKVLLDAFATAYKVPNSLRKIFAEGALSAAFIPTLVRMKKKGETDQINRLMTLSFLLIEGALLGLCILMIIKVDWLFRFIAPGWFVGSGSAHFWGIPIPGAWVGQGEPLIQVAYAVSFFRILLALIVFLSSSSLLAGALQSVHHFFIPAISPVLLNIVFVIGLIGGLFFGFSPEVLCGFIVLGSIIQFVLHLAAYFSFGFRFDRVKRSTFYFFNEIMGKFFPCLFSMSIMEINLFIDTSFASYLPKGSIYLIYLANRFMGIPQGVFATAFSTILLPHFSRINTYAPKRLSFYLLEVTKFVAWVTIPIALIMMFFAHTIFSTLFQFTRVQVADAQGILIAFLLGLFFFSLNKILLNLYYALHATKIPAYITVVGTVVNVTLNSIFIQKFQATGLALATTCSAIVQTILFVIGLGLFFKFRFYGKKFLAFFVRYVIQLSIILLLLYQSYQIIISLIALLSAPWSTFFLYEWGIWLWVGPLCLLAGVLLYYTRRLFGVALYFLD